MRTQQQRSQFNLSFRSMLILSVILLFSCSYRLLAQQKDGESTSPSSTESNAAPSRPAVNVSYLFNDVTIQNGFVLEAFGASSSRGIFRGHPTIPGAEVGTTTADPLMFSTNGAERMRITSTGFLGVGVTNPGTPLDLLFADTSVYSATTPSPARIRLVNGNTTNNNVFEINLAAFDTNSNISTGVRLAGIFKSHTASATTADFAIGLRNAGTIFEIARFASTGRVGIGTPNPQDALHVYNTAQTVGTIRLQGGNNYAGFIGNWEGNPMLLLTNNRHPGTGLNYTGAVGGAQITVGTATLPGDIGFYTTASGTVGTAVELMRIRAGGQVGIGTDNPGYKLDVQGGSINASGGLCINGTCKTSWSGIGSSQWTTAGTEIYYSLGNVGIGTTDPEKALHVVGDVKVQGNIAAKYQDLAEWVPADEQFDAGTVVVLDSNKSNHVISANKGYDTRVAGVISAQPGIMLGEKSDSKVLVATTGRVLVNVDATNGPIEIGDLLVTSDREGFAMKSMPVEIGGARIHRPGTLIGKALEPLRSGTGKILVLLSLQ